MSRPEERDRREVATPWTATERLFERGTHATLAVGTAVGRATAAATRRQFELWETAVGAGPTERDVDAAATGGAAGDVEGTRAVEGRDASTTESAFDRFLDAAAPFGHPAVDEGR